MLEFILLTGSLPLPRDLLLSPHSFLIVLILSFFFFYHRDTQRGNTAAALSPGWCVPCHTAVSDILKLHFPLGSEESTVCASSDN